MQRSAVSVSPIERLRALLSLAAFGIASSALAAPTPYHVATLVDLTVDGQPADSARVDGAFGKGLAGAGLTWVTGAAAGIPDVAAAEGGAGFPGADLVVIARIQSRKLVAGFRGSSLVRYEASAEARVLATETGEVLGTLTAEAPGLDLGAESAARIAASRAAAKLAAQVSAQLPAFAASPGSVELFLTGLPDGAEADRVAGFLAAHAAIDSAKILGRDGKGAESQTRMRLTARDLPAGQLAELIDGTRGLGLRVVSHTLRRVFVSYAPERRVRLAIQVRPLADRTNEPHMKPLLPQFRRCLRTALAGAPGFESGVDNPAFTVEGAISVAGKKGRIDLRLLAPDGSVVARVAETGVGERFSRTVRRAARGLGRAGLAKARDDAKVRQIAGLPLKLPKATEAPPSMIADVELRPALLGSPVVAEVKLASAEEGAIIEVRDSGGAWTERTAERAADGLTRVFERASPDEPGAVDVTVAMHRREAGKWQSEQVRTTAVVHPEGLALWAPGG